MGESREERKGKERKGKERKGKEGKGRKRKKKNLNKSGFSLTNLGQSHLNFFFLFSRSITHFSCFVLFDIILEKKCKKDRGKRNCEGKKTSICETITEKNICGTGN